MNIAAVVTDFAGVSKENHVPILAIATLIMWLKLCYFGRIFLSTAWMVRMIYAVTYDMGYFLIVFGIMVLGFANANYVLSRNGTPQFTGDNFWYAIIYSYRTGIGDFNTDDFEANSEKELIWIIWLLSSFLILIVLLNMLIAIISDIFEKVHENISNNLLKELAVLMVETELLISRKRLFKNKKYLIIIAQEKGETSRVDAESKLMILKQYMFKKVNEQEKRLKEISVDFEKFLEEETESKLVGMSTDKSLASLSEKLDEFERIANDCKEMCEKVEGAYH